MCGIYGAIGSGLTPAEGQRALETLRRRGPDGSSTYIHPEHDVFLGHTRLSIIDLSPAGTQPMSNEDGTLWLTLNGEIYNHEELRAELIRKGHRFRGHCDAEVVLHLYEEEGFNCLQRLRGMFAFGLYDIRKQQLFLARDRIGIKPLYYYDDGRRIVFASELKAIRAAPRLDLTPDVTAYYDYLTYQFVPAPKSIYRRVRKLPAGHWLSWSAGKAQVQRYWDVSFAPDRSMTEARALEELDALMNQVVRDHLIADVPVGAFLSGGFDSSVTSAYATRNTNTRMDAFTIRFPDRGDNEWEVAESTARLFGMNWHVQDCGLSEVSDRVPQMADLYDEPFADQASLPMLGLAQLAASHVKVVVSGDGGDETHLGYPRFFKEQERRFRHGLADALTLNGALVRRTPLARFSAARNTLEGPLGRVCYFHHGIGREAKRLFLDIHSPELRDYDDYWLYREHLRDDLSPLARQQYLAFKTTLPELILSKVDRTTMHYGLEARPALLDHRLVDFLGTVPDELKCKGGEHKHLLKVLLRRRLGEQPMRQKRRGFSTPIRYYVEERGMFRLQTDLDVMGAFSIPKDKMDRMFKPARDSHAIWMVHVLERFLAQQNA